MDRKFNCLMWPQISPEVAHPPNICTYVYRQLPSVSWLPETHHPSPHPPVHLPSALHIPKSTSLCKPQRLFRKLQTHRVYITFAIDNNDLEITVILPTVELEKQILSGDKKHEIVRLTETLAEVERAPSTPPPNRSIGHRLSMTFTGNSNNSNSFEIATLGVASTSLGLMARASTTPPTPSGNVSHAPVNIAPNIRHFAIEVSEQNRVLGQDLKRRKYLFGVIAVFLSIITISKGIVWAALRQQGKNLETKLNEMSDALNTLKPLIVKGWWGEGRCRPVNDLTDLNDGLRRWYFWRFCLWTVHGVQSLVWIFFSSCFWFCVTQHISIYTHAQFSSNIDVFGCLFVCLLAFIFSLWYWGLCPLPTHDQSIVGLD